MDKRLVVGLAGMPGAGKSIVVRVSEERSYGVHVMGDIVREEATRRGLHPTPENLGKIMLELRQKEGPAVISTRSIPKIEQAIQDKIMIDGIRNLDEVEEFKKHFVKFTLLSIHSSPKTRFRRLSRRGRSDDPKTWGVFYERDVRELGVGLGNAIAMAEHMVVNEGELAALREKVGKILQRIEEKWMR